MSDQEKQILILQKGFAVVLIDIEIALLDKDYETAFNLVRQAKKDILGDLEPKENELVDDSQSNN